VACKVFGEQVTSSRKAIGELTDGSIKEGAMKARSKSTRLPILIFFAAILIPICWCATSARAEYPERPISLLVSYPVGGSADASARVLASGAEKYLGQPLVIENKGGAGGTLALSLVANVKPDGYTICMGANTGVVRAPQMQKVPFKPLRSFTPIMAYCGAHNSALCVKADAPWKTLKDFIDYAKQNPGKIKYGHSGVGTAMHQAMEYLAVREGIKWVPVPYPGGAPAIVALLGGHIPVASVGPGWEVHVQAGALRCLGTHEYKRSAAFPDIPTFREQGYDYVNESNFGIFGPAGLPPDIVKKLESAFTKGTETPQFRAVIEKFNLVSAYYNSKDYDQHLKELWVRMEQSLKETGLIKEPATQPY
jgi:tripartite-type tricarboxylate transporter receptor subunit TctC